MNKWGGLLIVFSAILVAAGVVFAGTGASIADKGGCPNPHSETGGSHADEHSAHGSEKREERGCDDAMETPTPDAQASATPTADATEQATPEPTATPTATPAPTPTPSATPTEEPTPTATATPEPTATPTETPPTEVPTPTPVPGSDVEIVGVTVSLPATAFAGVPFMMSVDISVRNNGPVVPAVVDTTFAPALPAGCTATTGAITVQNTALTGNLITTISRAWNVTCTATGSQGFTVNGSAAIDPLQPAVDPNPANNSGTGGSSTIVS